MAGRSVMLHAMTMARRNLRAYAMLSVTIILSYALLLGYFTYSDSTLYNTYKDVFSWPRQLVSIYDQSGSQSKYEALMNRLETIPDTHSYTILSAGASILPADLKDEEGRYLVGDWGGILCVPSQMWSLHRGVAEQYEITWLDDKPRDGVELASGEALLDEYTYRLLGLDQKEDPVFSFSVRPFSGRSVTCTVRITGIFPTNQEFSIQYDPDYPDTVVMDYMPMWILSLTDINPEVAPDMEWSRYIIVHSQSPEQVYQAADSMNFGPDAVYLYQNKALNVMRDQKQIKAVIAAALLLLLGINLYSSFNNALSDRKFEIGVKRALGASKWSIVRQFLYESILVMLLDILMSVVLVMNAALLYKLIYESIPDQFGEYHEFVLWLSPHSIAMFLTCSISLSVIFTIIFAYKSTQVQVVDYLKAE